MWMFRWLQKLFAHRAASSAHGDPRWVEPSNAITRAVLAGMVAELPLSAKPVVVVQAPAVEPEPAMAVAAAPQPAVSAIVEEEAAVAERVAAQPGTRTAQRTRRRRASRAA